MNPNMTRYMFIAFEKIFNKCGSCYFASLFVIVAACYRCDSIIGMNANDISCLQKHSCLLTVRIILIELWTLPYFFQEN